VQVGEQSVTKSLIPAERHKRIREYLAIHHIAQNAILSELLQVSEATVRRDLEVLEEQGVLERTHGGAALTQRMRLEPTYAHSAQAHADEKRRIGVTAARLIEDGDTIFVNSGTTTTQVIRHIHSRSQVTVITNNVSAAIEAQDAGYDLILLGGSFRSRSNSVVGRFAADALRQVYASKAFIGVDGFSLRHGCTTPIGAEAEIARLMIERTRGTVVVVADHSKWGVVSNFEIAPLDKVHTLVSDDWLDAQARVELSEHVAELLIAGVETEPDGKR
jgi:DeoR family fructose operon transcriptional repressor